MNTENTGDLVPMPTPRTRKSAAARRMGRRQELHRVAPHGRKPPVPASLFAKARPPRWVHPAPQNRRMCLLSLTSTTRYDK